METILKFQDLELDTKLKMCFKGERKLPLTKHEFRILKTLVEKQDNYLEREELIYKAWGRPVSRRAVDIAISRLREKLGPDYILTKPGYGYGMIND